MTTVRVDPGHQAEIDQAGYFRTELQQQIRILDREMLVLNKELAKCMRVGHSVKANRIQREMRTAAIQRREVADMLRSLSIRFPRRSRP